MRRIGIEASLMRCGASLSAQSCGRLAAGASTIADSPAAATRPAMLRVGVPRPAVSRILARPLHDPVAIGRRRHERLGDRWPLEVAAEVHDRAGARRRWSSAKYRRTNADRRDARRRRRRRRAGCGTPRCSAAAQADRGAAHRRRRWSRAPRSRACSFANVRGSPGSSSGAWPRTPRRSETARGIRRGPFSTAAASSASRSAKYRNGLDAENSCPWKSIGVPGTSSR